MRISPGDYVMVTPAKGEGETPLPAEVQQIRYVNTKNGESAVAVVVEIGEMPTARVLELEVIRDPGPTLNHYVDFNCVEVIAMADPKVIEEIQTRLVNQREHMRLAIQASQQAPRELSFGGRGSAAGREKQKERAKAQREEAKTMRENAIAAKMAESNCSRADAIAYFTKMAQQGGLL